MKIIFTILLTVMVFLPINLYAIDPIRIIASDGQDRDSFGSDVYVFGDYAIIGAHNDDDDGEGAGSAYIFHYDGEDWIEQAKLTASDGEQGSFFGESVYINNDFAVVGAPGKAGRREHGIGAIYIFERDGDSWEETARFVPENEVLFGSFGRSIAEFNNKIYVSHPRNSGDGEIYIYEKIDNNWQLQETLAPEREAGGAAMGVSIDIDGNRLIAGAPDHGDNDGGAAYCFTYIENEWQEVSFLKPDGLGEEDYFGNLLALKGDYAVISSFHDIDDESLGAVYIYKNVDEEWEFLQVFEAPDGVQYFGFTIDITNDLLFINEVYASHIYRLVDDRWRNIGSLIDEEDEIPISSFETDNR